MLTSPDRVVSELPQALPWTSTVCPVGMVPLRVFPHCRMNGPPVPALSARVVLWRMIVPVIFPPLWVNVFELTKNTPLLLTVPDCVNVPPLTLRPAPALTVQEPALVVA